MADRAALGRIRAGFNKTLPVFDPAAAVGLKAARWLNIVGTELADREQRIIGMLARMPSRLISPSKRPGHLRTAQKSEVFARFGLPAGSFSVVCPTAAFNLCGRGPRCG